MKKLLFLLITLLLTLTVSANNEEATNQLVAQRQLETEIEIAKSLSQVKMPQLIIVSPKNTHSVYSVLLDSLNEERTFWDRHGNFIIYISILILMLIIVAVVMVFRSGDSDGMLTGMVIGQMMGNIGRNL